MSGPSAPLSHASTYALILLLTLLILSRSALSISIEKFGAVAATATTEAAQTNAQAIEKALVYASTSPSDKVVLIPNKEYFIFSVVVSDIHKVTIKVEGVLTALNDITNWPLRKHPTTGKLSYQDIFHITDSTDITVVGGKVDGMGYQWWFEAILDSLSHGDPRPTMFWFERVKGIYISDMYLTNAPMYHVYLQDVVNVIIHDMEIYVSVEDQKQLFIQNGKFDHEKELPLFPLNTDGIDPAGSNVTIYNIKVENYDDVVAVKPSNGGFQYSKCSSNISVTNATVTYGVGMTIGSVPPHINHSCVKGVSFKDVTFDKPFKAIYIKTNPGVKGTGEITDILYENIHIHESIWWGIYIGPQQQFQPDGTGPGCLLYPLRADCPTNPLVPINDITLKDVTEDMALLLPGIMRCNATSPCGGFVFDNVNIDGPFAADGWICDNVSGTSKNSSPSPSCLKNIS